MARLPRIVIPGQPQHLLQRGNDHAPCFFADEDYRFYLDCLKDAATPYGSRQRPIQGTYRNDVEAQNRANAAWRRLQERMISQAFRAPTL